MHILSFIRLIVSSRESNEFTDKYSEKHIFSMKITDIFLRQSKLRLEELKNKKKKNTEPLDPNRSTVHVQGTRFINRKICHNLRSHVRVYLHVQVARRLCCGSIICI